MNVAILDAQGAGLGQTVIRKIRKEIGDEIYLIALGTNFTAAYNMKRAGANEVITGEFSICSFCLRNRIDCIIGPIGIFCSGGINGEITPAISEAVFRMDCTKYIIPLKRHGIFIPGTRNLKIKEIIQEIVIDIKKYRK